MGHWGTSWIDNPHVDTLTVLISNDIRCLGTETIEKPFAFIYWGNGRTWDPFAPRLRTQDGEHPEPPDLERPRHPSTNPAMSRIYSEINDDDDDDVMMMVMMTVIAIALRSLLHPHAWESTLSCPPLVTIRARLPEASRRGVGSQL